MTDEDDNKRDAVLKTMLATPPQKQKKREKELFDKILEPVPEHVRKIIEKSTKKKKD